MNRYSLLGAIALLCLLATKTQADFSPADLPPAEALSESRPAPGLPDQQQRQSVPRVWPHQPPVIPHDIRGQQMDSRHHRCLDCHQGAGTKLTGATPLPPSHYRTRERETLERLAGARYRCIMCHVPQQPAELLTESRFGQSPEAVEDKQP